MPPKATPKKVDKGQQKALERQKQKIVEDKTFGLKNKNKSKAVQKFIKGVQQQVKGPQKGGDLALAKAEQEKKEEKKRELQQKALLAALFKDVKAVEKKEPAKIDIYNDPRDAEASMATWSQAKLEEVVAQRHGAENKNRPTAIICKHFLDALENKKYGWFWSCPNGGEKCIYKHCLPPGYVLKAEAPKEGDDEAEEEPLEEVLERERAELTGEGTPVTLDTFRAWKERKEKERLAKVESDRLASEKKQGGKGLNILSGRDLFTYDPTLFVDDDAAADADAYEEDESYWKEMLNANQKAVDEANASAAAASSSAGAAASSTAPPSADAGNSGSASQAEDTMHLGGATQSSDEAQNKSVELCVVDTNKAHLFLEGDDPDLDALDEI